MTRVSFLRIRLRYLHGSGARLVLGQHRHAWLWAPQDTLGTPAVLAQLLVDQAAAVVAKTFGAKTGELSISGFP